VGKGRGDYVFGESIPLLSYRFCHMTHVCQCKDFNVCQCKDLKDLKYYYHLLACSNLACLQRRWVSVDDHQDAAQESRLGSNHVES